MHTPAQQAEEPGTQDETRAHCAVANAHQSPARPVPKRVQGFFDGIDGTTVYGWVYDEDNPGHSLSVEVIVNEKVVARGIANVFRPDLAAANIGDGHHQFQVALPRRLLNGDQYDISVREEITGMLLGNSPKPFQVQKNTVSVPVDVNAATQCYQEGVIAFDEKKWEVAEKLFKEAGRYNPGDAQTLWMLAKTLDKIGRLWEAAEAAAKAISIDPRHASWHSGYGSLMGRMGRLEESEVAYRKAISLKPDTYDNYYRLGHILEQAGNMEEADYAYSFAVELDPADIGRRFGPGAYHALRGLWPEAAKAYDRWIQREGEGPELYYRLGLAYDRSYQWNKAAHAYRKAISLDSTVANWHYRLGFVLERTGAWSEAAEAYRCALARKETHDSTWYYRLGYALTQAGAHASACEAYRWTIPRGRPYGVEANSYDKNATFVGTSIYNEYYECLPLERQTILYESFHGASMSCNPLALFKYLVTDERFAGWTHVWVVNEKSKIPDEYKKCSNVIFITRGCDLYMRYLATASHLINNVSFPEYYVRKTDQVYLNTWHGTPLKTLGKDIKAPFLDHKNVARNFLHASHLISPNRHTTETITQRYDIADIYGGLVAETGYPRVDMTLNTTEEEKAQLRKLLGAGNDKKIILYAPTWRGTTGKAAFDAEKLCADMAKLSSLDALVLFRGHHMTEKVLAGKTGNLCVVPEAIDTNSLLSVVDILVTDYSSIYFDFLSTGRPIIHYMFDYDSYCGERGLYFPPEAMPGIVCQNIIDVKFNLKRLLNSRVEASTAYLAAAEDFSKFDDGQACARVVDFVFNGEMSHVTPVSSGREAILFFEGPFPNNGITTSFINLMANIDRERYQPVIAVDPENISKHLDRLAQFELVCDNASILGRAGSMTLSVEERWIIDKYNTLHAHAADEMHSIYANAYRKEFYRMFGGAKFCAHVNFEGYSRFWTSLLAYGPKSNNTVFLHNDMYEEWKTKYPSLLAILSLYTHYNKVLSVSELTNNRNAKNLSDAFGINEEKFGFCINTINPDHVRSLSELRFPDNIASLTDTTRTVFMSMGRMSPEKDHRKLIDAFDIVHSQYPETELWILGDGPLRTEIDMQIEAYGLQDAVRLLGQQSNPFPLLKRADSFVLSSNHEGQPMVLLESLILEKPVISTDIAGTRSVLQNGYGHLVQNDAESLADGMIHFLENRLRFQKFDASDYKNFAINMFYSKVIVGHATVQ